MMNNGFVELENVDSLDRFMAEANGSPIVIFKHSEMCGISTRAYLEMEKLAERKARSAPGPLAGV